MSVTGAGVSSIGVGMSTVSFIGVGASGVSVTGAGVSSIGVGVFTVSVIDAGAAGVSVMVLASLDECQLLCWRVWMSVSYWCWRLWSVFGSCFKTLAINFVSDFLFLALVEFNSKTLRERSPATGVKVGKTFPMFVPYRVVLDCLPKIGLGVGVGGGEGGGSLRGSFR